MTHIASFISWLRKQPADRRYDYYDAYDCVVARWLNSVEGGPRFVRVLPNEIESMFGEGSISVFRDGKKTYGGVLKRLETTRFATV